MVVVLDEDIARFFKASESVKAVFRAIITTMPPRGKSTAARRTVEG